MKKKVTRKETRECLTNFCLGCELVKVTRRFFPNLMERLGRIADPRHQAYVKYKSHVLLATRILSAIFYISSMRTEQ